MSILDAIRKWWNADAAEIEPETDTHTWLNATTHVTPMGKVREQCIECGEVREREAQ